MPPLAPKPSSNGVVKSSKPKLVNRGPAGLLTKLHTIPQEGLQAHEAQDYSALLPLGIKPVRDKISEGLADLIVDINSLVPDPNNARVHNDRNMQVIRASLCTHGQTIPVVVRKATMVVVAGNGRLQAAKDLGWSKIAANIMDMTEEEAAAYALTDNRSAELALWDFENVAALEKIAQSGGYQTQGWSLQELVVLRTTDDWSEYSSENPSEEEPEELHDDDEVSTEKDAELLERLQVTIAEPATQVEDGQVYRVGHHLMVIGDPIRQVSLWRHLLTDEMIFAPYPSILIPLSHVAQERTILLVQPDHYIAGHLLDHYKSIYGESEVQLVTAEG